MKRQTKHQNQIMTGMLELSVWEFKNFTYMLSILMDKVDNMQEQMGNISRDLKILRKKKTKGNGRDQKHCNRNKNAFDEFLKLNTVEERNSKISQ